MKPSPRLVVADLLRVGPPMTHAEIARATAGTNIGANSVRSAIGQLVRRGEVVVRVDGGRRSYAWRGVRR